MVLLLEKDCCLCGNEASLFKRAKLVSGEFICKECMNQCSEEMTYNDFIKLRKEDVQSAIAEHKNSYDIYVKEYKQTKEFNNALSIDEEHQWWINPKRKEPDVFSFNQFLSYELQLETDYIGEHDSKSPTHVFPEREDFPVCKASEKVIAMNLLIYINHPYISTVSLTIMDNADSTDEDVEKAYQLAEKICDFFEHKTFHEKEKKEVIVNIDNLKKLKDLVDLNTIPQ